MTEETTPATPNAPMPDKPKIKVTYISLSREGNIVEREVDEGTTLAEFVEKREQGAVFEDLTVKVNSVLMEYDDGNYVLKSGDKITVTSKRYGGAA